MLAGLRLTALLGWLALCAPLHLISRSRGRSGWPRRFLRGVGWIVGARVATIGNRAEGRTLLISNHVSWLDIPVLAGATGCAFVSKEELKGHALMRWLCQENGTVFVDRSDKRGINHQADHIRRAVEEPQPLALFPEGTIGPEGRLLPFRPPLLSAFAPPPPGVSIRPVAIDYGGCTPDVVWGPGETGVANFLRVLGRRGSLPVAVRLLAPLAPCDDRKALARVAHDAVDAALTPSDTPAADV